MNPALRDLIRPHYLALQGYVSAGMESGKDESRVFLNANENPFELPGLEGFNRYPEPQPAKLREAYANLYGVQPDNVIMTRGADEAIVVLTKLFCEPHKDKILTTPPTFALYAVNANAMPVTSVIEVPLLKKNGTYELDKTNIIARAKKDKAKLVYLCAPNNPTATAIPHADILEITKALEGISVIVLDETYAEFSKQGSLVPKLDVHPNLIILRTLSKSYALAGERMGVFLAGDQDFVRFVRGKCLDIYPLPVSTIKAALHVMSPEIQKIARENIKKLLAEREYLITGFTKSPLIRHIYPSDTNFFLAEMTDAKGFCDYCAKHNIVLRDFSSKPLTENCLRISAGTREQNDALLKLLKDYEQVALKNSAA